MSTLIHYTESYAEPGEVKVESFPSQLTNEKMPVDYYKQHVKNLGTFGVLYI